MLKRKSHYNSLDNKIVFVIVCLMAIGSVFVFSASANISKDIDLNHLYRSTGLRQILFFPLAVIIMLSFSALNYQKLKLESSWFKLPTVYLLIIAVALLALILLQRIHNFLPNFIHFFGSFTCIGISTTTSFCYIIAYFWI